MNRSAHRDSRPTRHILLATPEGPVLRSLKSALSASGIFLPTVTGSFPETLALLTTTTFDAAILDLALPGFSGPGDIIMTGRKHPGLPLIVLVQPGAEADGIEAVRLGAQDFLVQYQIDESRLVHRLFYAMDRHRDLIAARALTFVDELTGLYNRRGFLAIAPPKLEHATRMGWKLALFFVDMDNMKVINDTHGHSAGDQALLEVTAILRDSFRTSDILARLGGDEFVALAPHTSQGAAEAMIHRLTSQFRSHRTIHRHPFRIALSAGLALFDPSTPRSLEELMEEADSRMYELKRRKAPIVPENARAHRL